MKGKGVLRSRGQIEVLSVTKVCDIIVMSNDYNRKELLHAHKEKGI